MSDSTSNREGAKALARVLGPGGQELSCEECFAQLDRCPACAEDFRSLRDFVAGEG